MANIYRYSIVGHKNIYLNEEQKQRELVIEYGEPIDGVNSETGLLILVPGYGGNINSNVYRKMKKEIPDKYNMIVMQCDYFGNKYMHSDNPKILESLLSCQNLEKIILEWKCTPADMGETINEFNDMGIMQALDIVNSTLNFIIMNLRDGKEINMNKIVLFGHSHGAYISYIANRICPKLYSYIIDISSYIYPYYINNDRDIMYTFGEIGREELIIEPFVKENKEVLYDEKLYNLKYLYEKFENNCNIIAVHGTEDWMVPISEKKSFIDKIDNAEIVIITPDMVDEKLFKNADHGLGADYLELVDVFLPMIANNTERKSELELDAIVNVNDELIISYQTGIPELQYIKFN